MKEYWKCFIGPVESSILKNGADFPLRIAVRQAFENLTGKNDYSCSSGWGADEEIIDLFS